MTAAELIEHLRQVAPDTPVLVEGYESGWDAIHEVKTSGVVRYRRAQAWDGEFKDAADFGQEGDAAIVIVGRREAHRR